MSERPRRRSYAEKLDSADSEERYAMRFALALLMPRQKLIAHVMRFGPDPVLIAAKFQVPTEAARLRVQTIEGPLPWRWRRKVSR